jgi:hypothetical protein
MTASMIRSGWRHAVALRCLALALLAFGAAGPGGTAWAQATAPLLDEVRTIGLGSEPVERTFAIATAGTYEIVLRDLATPAALQSVKLAITRGRQVVSTLDAAGTVRFEAVAGTHVARVVASPAAASGSGSFGVSIKNVATNVTATEFVGVASLPPPVVPETQRIVDTAFPISAAGSYQVSLADFALPQALSRLTLVITRDGGSTLAARLDAAGVATFVAEPGNYRLLAVGESPAAVTGGLFGIRVVGLSTGTPVYVQAFAVGRTALIGSATLANGGHTLALRDFAFPAALATRAAIVLREAQQVVRTSVAATVPFTAVAGTYQVFAYALATAPPGSGNYEVELRPDAGAALLSEVRSASAGTNPVPTFTFPFDVPAAGAYQIRLTDFEFPVALAATSLAAWQAGASPGTLATPGTLNATLASGRAYLLVSARPGSGGSGLFGLSVTSATAGATPLLETTQAVGALFSVRRLAIAETARHDVNIADLGFPANFADLAGVITRGATRVGSIFGGGTFSFDATPGAYFVNFLAQPSATALAGTYALTVSRTPPAPTVTLNSSSASVVQGTTVDLTWSSTNATACTASGGWSGTRTPTGTERSPAINGSTTFSLECAGAGGRASASTVVAATTTSSGGGGGGSMSLPALLALLLLGLRALLLHRLPHQRAGLALDSH